MTQKRTDFRILTKVPNKPIRYNIDAIAEYLNITKLYVYKLSHLKKIPHIKIGRELLFDKKEIDAWVETKRVPVREKEKKKKSKTIPECEFFLVA